MLLKRQNSATLQLPFRVTEFKLFVKTQKTQKEPLTLPLFLPKRLMQKPASGRRAWTAQPEPDVSSAWGTEGARQGPVS